MESMFQGQNWDAFARPVWEIMCSIHLQNIKLSQASASFKLMNLKHFQESKNAGR